jgi:4,5-DOPA dioxygenase extradiol
MQRNKRPSGAPARGWVHDSDGWVLTKAEAGAIGDIAGYRTLAPHARKNHPAEEHFLPLALAFGAGGAGAKGKRVHASVERGVMAMDAYIFE